MDGDDGWFVVKNWGVEVGEMHQVEFFFVELVEKNCLFGEGIVRGVDDDFFDARGGRVESGEFWFVEKEHVFIFVIHAKKIFGQFVNVTADAGETGGVHSAVDADFH